MKRSFLIVFLLFSVILSLSSPVLASDVDGTVPGTVPDTSGADIITITDVYDTLCVIQAQLWVFLVVLILFFSYKFLRLFF